MSSYSSYNSDSPSLKDRLKQYVPGKLHFARAGFVVYIFVGFFLGIFFRDGGFGLYNKIPYLQQGCQAMIAKLNNSCVGMYMIHRISFSMVLFYLAHALLSSPLMCCCNDKRIKLQLQYHWITWLIRPFFFIALLVASFFIPNPFFHVYAWIALFMSAIFLLIQVVLLIDFAYEWAESWRAKCPEDKSYTAWDILMVIIAVILYAISIAIVVCLFVFLGSGASCHLNRFFICSVIILSVIITFAGMAAKRGILPPSIVTIYCVSLVWGALLSDPDKSCNSLLQFTKGTNTTMTAVAAYGGYDASMYTPSSSFTSLAAIDPMAAFISNNTWSQIVTLVMSVLLCAFSVIRTAISTGSTFNKLFSFRKSGSGDDDDDSKEALEDKSNMFDEEQEKENIRAEGKELFYSHIVFVFCSFYLSMILSNWNVSSFENQAILSVDEGEVAVWVKMVTAWITVALFVWSVLAPYILGRCRDFGQHNVDD